MIRSLFQRLCSFVALFCFEHGLGIQVLARLEQTEDALAREREALAWERDMSERKDRRIAERNAEVVAAYAAFDKARAREVAAQAREKAAQERAVKYLEALRRVSSARSFTKAVAEAREITAREGMS